MANTDIGRMDIDINAAAPTKSLVGKDAATFNIKKRNRPGETVIGVILFFCGIVSIFTTLGIVFVLGEESLLFFDSRAWVLAKHPVAQEASTAELGEAVDADERVLTLNFAGERIPYTTNSYIQIGDEMMQVVERGRNTITVDRGAFDTERAEHATNDPIFPVVEQQIRPQNDLLEDTTVIDLPAGYVAQFEEGMIIQLGTENMLITGIADDQLTVERGLEDTNIREHDAFDEQIFLPESPNIFEFFTNTQWSPQVGEFGIWPLLLSTIVVSAIAMLVSIPLGLGAAIYLSEYARPRVRSVLKPILEVLAGVPTVVYGFFALTFVTPILQGIFGQQVQFYNMLSAGLVVGILIVPLVSSLSEDALNAVPRALREASYGLGATKLETTIKVVLPAAVSGVAAAIIIAISRAIGETMIVAIAAGSGPNFTFNFFEGAETMTGHIARISGGDLSYNSIDYNSIFAIGALLFIVTLVLNIFSNWIARRLREAY